MEHSTLMILLIPTAPHYSVESEPPMAAVKTVRLVAKVTEEDPRPGMGKEILREGHGGICHR